VVARSATVATAPHEEIGKVAVAVPIKKASGVPEAALVDVKDVGEAADAAVMPTAAPP